MAAADAPAARPRAQKRSTVVGWINRKVRKLDWPSVEAQLRAPSGRARGVKLCRASRDSWSRYVASESQALASRAMEWRDGCIFIVDLPGRLHGAVVDALVSAMASATRTGGQCLTARIGAGAEPRVEPDVGFGPSRDVGYDMYCDWAWSEFQTLKVEVDTTSSGWAGLDARAARSRQYAGVEYVLCIYLSPSLRTRQFRLDAVSNGELERPGAGVVDIAGPATPVVLDSRRLLGLMEHAQLPRHFPDPSVTIDLYAIVRRAVDGK